MDIDDLPILNNICDPSNIVKNLQDGKFTDIVNTLELEDLQDAAPILNSRLSRADDIIQNDRN